METYGDLKGEYDGEDKTGKVIQTILWEMIKSILSSSLRGSAINEPD